MRFFYLFIALLITGCASRAANVTFTLQDFTTSAASGRRVTVTPLSFPEGGASVIISADKKQYTANTNGSFTITNMAGGVYLCELLPPPQPTRFYIEVPTNASDYAASALLVAPTNVIPAGSMAVTTATGDARYLARTNGSGADLTISNFTAVGTVNIDGLGGLGTNAYSLSLTGTAFGPLTVGANWLVVTNGNVGIGTNNPSNLLSLGRNTTNGGGAFINIVEQGNNTRLCLGGLKSSDGTYSLSGLWFNQDTPSFLNYSLLADSGGLYFNAPTGDSVAFRINNSTAMTIDANKRVGVGTNAPSTALEVLGTVKATAFSGDGSGITANQFVGSNEGNATNLNAYGARLHTIPYEPDITDPVIFQNVAQQNALAPASTLTYGDLLGKQTGSENLTNWSGLSTNVLSGLGGGATYAFNTNQFVTGSVTNISLKDGVKLTNATAAGFAITASGSPSSDDVLVFATDGAGGWHYDSNFKYSDLQALAAGGSTYQTVSNITASGTFGINVVPCTNTAGIHFNITLSAPSTFDAPTNSVDGQIVRLRFIQNSTGGYTVATNGTATASWKFGTAITGFDITTNANAVSYITMTYYAAGNTWHVIGNAPGY